MFFPPLSLEMMIISMEKDDIMRDIMQIIIIIHSPSSLSLKVNILSMNQSGRVLIEKENLFHFYTWATLGWHTFSILGYRHLVAFL